MRTQTIKSFILENMSDKTDGTINLLNDMSDTVTFEDVWKAPYDVYKLTNCFDSEIRCYIFEVLSDMYNVDYDDIYYRWLYAN